MPKWLCLVLVCLAVCAVSAQVDDNWDDYEAWWSDEASSEGLGLEDGKTDDSDDTAFQDNFKPPIDNTNDDNVDETLDGDLIDDPKDLSIEDDASKTNENNDEDFVKKEPAVDYEKASNDNDDIPRENKNGNSLNDQIVLDEIEHFQQQIDEPNSDIVDNFNDYQVEDNRSAEKDEDVEDAKAEDSIVKYKFADNLEADLSGKSDEIFDFPEFVGSPLSESAEDIIKDAKEILAKQYSDNEEDLANETQQDPKQTPLENDEINEETLEEDSDEPSYEDTFDEIIENQQNEEIKKFLDGDAQNNEDPFKETYDKVDDGNENEDKDMLDASGRISRVDDEAEQKVDDSDKVQEGNGIGKDEKADQQDSGEDTVDKVYADLNSDLAKLFKTWDKLNDNSDDNKEEVLDYEDKYGKPFREDVVLAQREEFENYDDGDVNSDDQPETADTDNKADDPLTDLFDVEKEENNDKEEMPIPYENDAHVADESTKEESSPKPAETSSFKTVNIDDITPSQYNVIMTQFAMVHKEEQLEDSSRNVAAIHVTLSSEEYTEITSPNYPNNYPSNNIVDWILEGDGMGIELNITDFTVRGVNGEDYLLIKPGGQDATGTDGLLFSYHLNSWRAYRFTDVNRVFVRFVSGSGLSYLRGFHMKVKNIWPPSTQDDSEPQPQPEALLPTPPSTISVSLGGLPHEDFPKIEEEFRRILADMATMYINANGIDMGMNATIDTTQITKTAVCNINWPGFEQCVQVTFGVPLVFEDEESKRLNEADLVQMWETYVFRDPFATRLRKMGIMVFPAPNDGRALLAWLVLAAGVVISAIMLSLALWRYSCFDNYTRMKNYSDTDSLREEKRGLDLYPTPHQTLPPLYSEADFKWADAKFEDTARVDMGGFANRNYVRDELLDIDSDDEVVAPRDRFTTDV